MLKIDEFRGYLAIDKAALDDEIIQQPSLFFRVCEEYVVAAAERDALKEQLSYVDAQLDAEVRRRLEREDAKATEAMVKAQVQTHGDHEAAFTEFVEAKKKADVLSALKEAFHMRGYMLRDLASLTIANYYGETSIKGHAVDTAVYKRQRQRLAEGRANRDG